MDLELVLKNRTEEKQKLLSALMSFAAEHHLPPKVVQAADLALEEHLTNILSYGYSDSEQHEILIRMGVSNGCLIIEVEDDGRAFNPLERPAADTTTPLAQKKAGGLGIHLMRSFMDDLVYARKGKRNVLTMRKGLSAFPA